jgi:hypothetical protein
MALGVFSEQRARAGVWGDQGTELIFCFDSGFTLDVMSNKYNMRLTVCGWLLFPEKGCCMGHGRDSSRVA